VIIPIRGEGLVEGEDENDEENQAGESSNAAQGQKLSYALHPNCGIFDDE
jgi:hypothetical protein